MGDVERIAGLPQVQPRQRTPGAADGVEISSLAALERRHFGQFLADNILGALERFLGNVLQRQSTER